MRLTGTFVPAFADDFAVAHQHAADARIGTGRVQARAPPDAAPAPSTDCQLRSCFLLAVLRRRVFLTASIASEKSPTSWKLLYTEAKRI